jgi:hypothetical protein
VIDIAASPRFSINDSSLEELGLMIQSPPERAKKIKELSALLRTLVLMGEYQLGSTDHPDFLRLLDKINFDDDPSQREQVMDLRLNFKDAIGRTHSLPWEMCNTWKVSSVHSFLLNRIIH